MRLFVTVVDDLALAMQQFRPHCPRLFLSTSSNPLLLRRWPIGPHWAPSPPVTPLCSAVAVTMSSRYSPLYVRCFTLAELEQWCMDFVYGCLWRTRTEGWHRRWRRGRDILTSGPTVLLLCFIYLLSHLACHVMCYSSRHMKKPLSKPRQALFGISIF